MYLTSQRVRRTDGASTGVNVFLHSHVDDAPISTEGDFHKVLKEITESHPGRLIDQHVELKPGGNTVLSYLDIVAPDNAKHDEIESALLGFEGAAAQGPWPVSDRIGRVIVSFGVVFGLGGLEAGEFARLREAALTVLAR